MVTLAELETDPHPLLARLRASEPVAWVPALAAWLVTSRELALRVMRDADTFTVDDARFSTGQVVGRSLLNTDGEEHSQLRAPFARAFLLEAVRERFTAIVEGEVERLIDGLEPAGEGELRRGFAGPLAAHTMMVALGLEDVGVEQMLRWYEAIVDATSGLAAGLPVPAAGSRAVEELRAHGAGPNEAVLLFGGIETTEGMICNALLHLLSYQDQLSLVRADRSLLANAIEESLRLEPSAASVDRYATREVEIGDATIGERDLVTVSIAAANRDPATFDEPDRFDIRRQNAGRHLSFAAGPHVCIGMHLARLEARVAIDRLLDRLPNLRLQGPAAPHGLVFRKPPELRVLWD